MTYEFEYTSYDDADGIVTLENIRNQGGRGGGVSGGGVSGGGVSGGGVSGRGASAGWAAGEAPTAAGIPEFPGFSAGTYDFPRASGSFARASAAPDGRTEALIDHGRQRAKRSRAGWLRAHWRAAMFIGALALVIFGILLLVLPGGSASWPASVAQVQSEITQACQNPNVAAEPSQLNFACAKDTRQILWVFSLLTSGDNPSFVDRTTGRRGLEPIQATQGGDIAWSLNLHHPYNPANPVDSLEVAARAVNNIISGATLTSSSGAPKVEGGLESSPANCQRYTGSAEVISKQGYPARCALAVTTPFGQAALVSDVFQAWMGGTPSQVAAEAGVLFENADDPGNPQVQAILASLHQS